MKKSDFLNDLCGRFSQSLPAQVKHAKEDIEKNFQAVLKKAFDKLELVTREEFDAQTNVLARTRKKLETLESEVKSLEKIIQQKKSHE